MSDARKRINMKHRSVGYRLPDRLTRPLFGDRARFGLEVQVDDPCWREWERLMPECYTRMQNERAGSVVSDAGYRICRDMDMTGRSILEIGPGNLGHLTQWQGDPKRYVIADTRAEMLNRAKARLQARGIHCGTALLSQSITELPFRKETFDLVICFYTLEHLYPLHAYVEAFQRVLTPSGMLVGAIPCEGGLAWGLGRWLTTRRWFRKNTSIDPDKIICWEHPNFAEQVLGELDAVFRRETLRFWPTRIPLIDANLILSFMYTK